MKALLLLTLLILTVHAVSAQETPDIADWTTEQRCITAPSQPPEGWTHEGVIFTFERGDGIHAHRADVETSYYVAFDNSDEFGAAGSFSPDGKWFAVPAGRTSYRSNSLGDNTYAVQEIRVYSTTPEHRLYQIPIFDVRLAMNTFFGVNHPYWLDNHHVVTEGQTEANQRRYLPYIFDPFQQEEVVMELPDYAHFASASPDNSRWIYYQGTASVNEPLPILLAIHGAFESAVTLPIQPMHIAPISVFPQWASDSSKFAAVLDDGTGIGVFDWNGNLLDTIPSDFYARMSFANDGKRLAYMTRGETIRIANLETRTITDTCIMFDAGFGYGLALSPNSSELAFSLPQAGFIYILDIEAWQAYRIDLAAADVIGWYALDEGK